MAHDHFCEHCDDRIETVRDFSGCERGINHTHGFCIRYTRGGWADSKRVEG